jgi:predicted nucleotidyltransferase
MRLTPAQHQVICSHTAAVFGAQAQVRLFGSRTDDQARGGDVDLLVSVREPVERPALRAAELAARLQMALDGMPVDVVLHAPNLRRLPIHDLALAQGIEL